MSVEETGSLELFEGKQQEITRQELVERVSEHVNRILRRNLYELKLDEKQTFRLLRQKEELRRYLKEAGTGNLQVKEYLISFIQEFLLNGMKMDEEMIKHTFFFSEKGSRQAAVRFDILLFLYKEQYGSGCEFPYKSRVMPTSEPLKTLKAPYMARNTMKWGFFRLKSQ